MGRQRRAPHCSRRPANLGRDLCNARLLARSTKIVERRQVFAPRALAPAPGASVLVAKTCRLSAILLAAAVAAAKRPCSGARRPLRGLSVRRFAAAESCSGVYVGRLGAPEGAPGAAFAALSVIGPSAVALGRAAAKAAACTKVARRATFGAIFSEIARKKGCTSRTPADRPPSGRRGCETYTLFLVRGVPVKRLFEPLLGDFYLLSTYETYTFFARALAPAPGASVLAKKVYVSYVERR